LGQTNSVAGQILTTAQSIDGHAAAIDQALTGAKPDEATIAEADSAPVPSTAQ